MHSYCGLKQQPAGYRFETSEYDQYQVIVVLDGELRMTVQNIVTSLQHGHMAVLLRGSTFRLHCDAGGSGYRGVFVTVSETDSREYFGPSAALRISPEVRAVAELIEAEARSPRDRMDMVLDHLGLLLAEYALRQEREQRQDAIPVSPESWVRYACRRIDTSLYTGQPLEHCLGGMPLSYRQLARHFQTVLGLSPKQYQLRCRLEEACRLLAGTRLPVTAIALDLGFASSQHFAGQFTARYGMTPTEYRAAGFTQHRER